MDWLIVILVVIAVAAFGALAMIQTRSTLLKRRFGPEYDRLVAEEGDRRSAEARLRERAKRRDALEIRDLTPAAASKYTEQWRAAQMRFVDDPAASVADADALVDLVARERGYPVDRRDEAVEMVSVDYPRLVGHYRVARAIHDRSEHETVTLDDLRMAFRSYRALFTELAGATTPQRRLASPLPAEGKSA
jgi:hypothetical protein